jgi:hypothetical protein
MEHEYSVGFKPIDAYLKKLLNAFCSHCGECNIQLAFGIGRIYLLFDDGSPSEFNSLEELVEYLAGEEAIEEEDVEEINPHYLESFEDYLTEILDAWYEDRQDNNIQLYIRYDGWGTVDDGNVSDDTVPLDQLMDFVKERSERG